MANSGTPPRASINPLRMSTHAPTKPPSQPPLQARLYHDLNRRLQNSSWNSSAAEAHGLLSGLACRGLGAAQLRSKMWLLQVAEKSDIALLASMYDLILRDLQADDFAFNLLLPPQPSENSRRRPTPTPPPTLTLESLADWCNGFAQGFLHDGEQCLSGAAAAVREALQDIMQISRLHIAANADQKTERQLCEIEQYLRVAAHVIFEESRRPAVMPTPMPNSAKPRPTELPT